MMGTSEILFRQASISESSVQALRHFLEESVLTVYANGVHISWPSVVAKQITFNVKSGATITINGACEETAAGLTYGRIDVEFSSAPSNELRLAPEGSASIDIWPGAGSTRVRSIDIMAYEQNFKGDTHFAPERVVSEATLIFWCEENRFFGIRLDGSLHGGLELICERSWALEVHRWMTVSRRLEPDSGSKRVR